MKPVEQAGDRDCFRACIASILELPIAALPESHFLPEPDDWFERASDYLCDHHDLYLAKFGVSVCSETDEPVVCIGDWATPRRGYWIATVNSINLPPDDDGEPRRHAIVMDGDHLAWDPSSKRKRADFNDETPIYYATMLVPLNAARHDSLRSQIEAEVRILRGVVPRATSIAAETANRLQAILDSTSTEGEGRT